MTIQLFRLLMVPAEVCNSGEVKGTVHLVRYDWYRRVSLAS